MHLLETHFPVCEINEVNNPKTDYPEEILGAYMSADLENFIFSQDRLKWDKLTFEPIKHQDLILYIRPCCKTRSKPYRTN